MSRKFQLGLGSLISCLGLSCLPFVGVPTQAAEQIYVSYSLLERSIPVSELETYAKTGQFTGQLRSFSRYLNKEQQEQFRSSLQAPVPLDPVTVSQFLYTPIGEQLLQRIGEVVRIKGGPANASFYAIRAALIGAAGDPSGFTALSVLQNFPAQGVQINLSQALSILSQVQTLVQQTETTVTAIQNQSQPAESPTLPNVRSLILQGPVSWQRTTLELQDQTARRVDLTGSARTFPVDVYIPAGNTPRPVVVISHGLNSDRSSLDYLAQHLASHGYVVAVPEHTGSNTQQLLNLVQGQAQDITKPAEFVARPLDIQFLLDELGRLAQANPQLQGRINLNQVGVVGQSFGGYTALALAGAPINFPRLQAECGVKLRNSFNLSQFLQCQALQLSRQDYQLADPRVKAVVLINPISSTIFGPESLAQVKVPVLMFAGSADTIAPALPEQFQPFTWLSSPQKYLAVIDGGTHFSAISEPPSSNGVLPSLPGLVGPSPGLARSYVEAVSLAFLQTYIANQSEYQAFLTPGYAAALSQSPLPFSLTNKITFQSDTPPVVPNP